MKKILPILMLFSLPVFAQRDTVKVIMLTSTSGYNATAFMAYGYVVREKRNTIEKDSSTVLCCEDYWQPVMYLDENKNCFPSGIIIWSYMISDWGEKELLALKKFF